MGDRLGIRGALDTNFWSIEFIKSAIVFFSNEKLLRKITGPRRRFLFLV